MTLRALFSRKERRRRKREKELEKDRKNLLKDDRDIRNFILWYLQRRYFKNCRLQKDKDVNFVWLGYEAQDHYLKLLEAHPYLATLTADELIKATARHRLYPWLDNEGNWNYWERAEMEDHYQMFLKNEEERNIYGDYTLFETGPLGSSKEYPACAYLSYAYHEEVRWQNIIHNLIKFMAHIDD